MTQSCFISEIDASLRQTLLSPKACLALWLALVASASSYHHLSLCPGSLIIKPEIRGLNKAWAVPAQEAQVSLYIVPQWDKRSPWAPYHIQGGVIGGATQTWKATACIQCNPLTLPCLIQFKQSRQNEEHSASWTQLSLRYCPKRRHSKNCVQST